MNRIIDLIEKEQQKTDAKTFKVGDSVRVHTRVVEGDKERIQIFTGIVIGRKGRGLNETFHRAPHFLRRRRRAGFSGAFAAYRQNRSGTSRSRAPRETELSSRPQRQGSHRSKRVSVCQLAAVLTPSVRQLHGVTRRYSISRFTRHVSTCSIIRTNLQMISAVDVSALRISLRKKTARTGVSRIAGIDEAGRGALAGPVVAAAVILPEKFRHRRLNDSKQLAPELREEIYCELISNPEIGWTVGVVDSIEIDRINILRASHSAMRVAIEALLEPPEHVLIDGLPVIPFPLPQTAIIDGDCISLSIAAASVIAKVTRDRMMRDFCAQFPAVLLQPAQRLRHRTASFEAP